MITLNGYLSYAIKYLHIYQWFIERSVNNYFANHVDIHNHLSNNVDHYFTNNVDNHCHNVIHVYNNTVYNYYNNSVLVKYNYC